MNRKPGLGVVIGRFQVPDLHDGHIHIIGEAERHQRALIMIGCQSTGPSHDDPLDYNSRRLMIQERFPYAMICPITDMPTNEEWSQMVDRMIYVHHQFGEVTLYAGRDSFAPYYTGKHQIKELELVQDHSGTEQRKNIAQVGLASTDFRHGCIYTAHNQFYPVKSAVDIACIRFDRPDINSCGPVDGEWRVLLAQKANAPGVWRFPGGFMDLDDQTRELAARRELREETSLTAEDWHRIGDFRVSDWRDTPESAIQSDFFVCRFTHGIAEPQDDLHGGDLQWFSLHSIKNSVKFADDHKKLAEALLGWLEANGPEKECAIS